MTTELFTCMVTAWMEVYAPIIQVGLIGMVTASVVLSLFVFFALLLRNYLTSNARSFPS
jgi:hypothetical protein